MAELKLMICTSDGILRHAGVDRAEGEPGRVCGKMLFVNY